MKKNESYLENLSDFFFVATQKLTICHFGGVKNPKNRFGTKYAMSEVKYI
jgi:hypothetical protein